MRGRSNAGTTTGIPAGHGQLQRPAQVFGVDPVDPDTLRSARLAAGQLDLGRLDAECLGHEGHDGGVGPSVGGWCAYLHFERVAVTPDDRGPACARMDVQAKDQIGRRIALSGTDYVEQVVDHGRLL